MGKMCFSKVLLLADYVILLVLVLMYRSPETDKSSLSIIIVAWIAQIAISSGAYYWKAKSENLVKLPITMLKDIPEDMRDRADPNQIIAAVLGIGTNNNNH